MASKLSKLQCFSTCLSAPSWVARREAVSLVKLPFLSFPFSLPARPLSSSPAFQTPNFVPLSPIVPLPHYPAKITLSFCCAIKLQPGEDWQCFSAEGGGQINVFVVAVCVCVCVCVCMGVFRMSECSDVWSMSHCSRMCVCVCVYLYICVCVCVCVWPCLTAITEDNRALGNARLQGQGPLFYWTLSDFFNQ